MTIAFPGKTPDQLRELQEDDDNFGTLIKWLKGPGPTPTQLQISTPALRHFWMCRDQFIFISDVLYYRWEDFQDSRFLLCVPSTMRDDVFFYCHDSMWEGHPGEHWVSSSL